MTGLNLNRLPPQIPDVIERIGKRYSWRLSRWMVKTLNRVGTIEPTPVLILGNQKSGTTAIAALLAAATRTTVTLDIEEMMKATILPELQESAAAVRQFVARNKLAFARTVVKEPWLTFIYPQLREVFPHGRFVFVSRDPRQNIRSILNRLSLPGNAEQLSDAQLQGVRPVWLMVLDGRWLGLRGDTYIEMLAARWNRAAEAYLDDPERIVLIRYEDFVLDKHGAIASLARRVGLEPTRDIADRVDVQYQPRGNREVSLSDFFGPGNLRRIETICRCSMLRLGYD